MRNDLASVALILAMACIPSAKTPTERALDARARCDGTDMTHVLAQSAIDSVAPAYDYAQGGPNDRIARLSGAEIHLRPLPGASSQGIARALECHEARVMLGESCGAPDPYHPANGGWIDVDVQADKDGFVVRLTSDDVDEARAVLERARTYAQR